MPGDSGVTVVTMLVCSFYCACEAAGASCARHSLRPLIVQGQELGRGARRDREAMLAAHFRYLSNSRLIGKQRIYQPMQKFVARLSCFIFSPYHGPLPI